MIPELEEEVAQEAKARAVVLPPDWSVRDLVDELQAAMLDVDPAVLKMAASLRSGGAYVPRDGVSMRHVSLHGPRTAA